MSFLRRWFSPGNTKVITWSLLGAGFACSCAVSGLSAEESEDNPAVPSGERPRIRYWLRNPVSPQEPAAERMPARERDASPKAHLVSENDLEADPPMSTPGAPGTREERVEPDRERTRDPRVSRTGRTIEERRQAMRVYFNRMVKKAKQAYKDNDYDRCVAICRNVLTADPRNIEVLEWLRRAHAKQAEADEEITKAAAVRKAREALLEAEEHSVRPPVRAPAIRPHWPRRSDDPSLPRRKKMTKLIDQRVTVDFMDADLDWVLNTLFILTGINIIADPAALEGKSLTIHVEDLPLRSVLDFIVRNNEGIQYSVTEDAIWITASDAADLKKIMELRVYPIHHGLTSTRENTGASSGSRSGNTGRAGRGPAGGAPGGGAAPGGQGAGSYLETVLGWLEEQQDTQTFPDGSKWIIDYKSNQLAVFTTPSGHDKLRSFLDAFDQPAIQVLIKARFLDVSLEDNNAFGVDIKRISVPDSGLKPLDFIGNTPTNLPGTLGLGSSFLITGLRTDPQFEVTMNMLLSNRNTRILSEPQILAINNKESNINISTHFSYITDLREVTGTTFGGDGTATQETIAFVPEFDTDEIGFTLFVTPSVGRNLKTINLHIHPVIDQLAQGQNISDFQEFTVVDDSQGTAIPPTIERPTIDQVELETDVVLQDNGYVIIGGLIRNRYETVERKIPGLHRIPYLGNLFKSKSTQKNTSNLMVIIEAQIITPGGRTYRTLPQPDDGDIREGGVNRAPGQVSQLRRTPAVNRALGLQPRTSRPVQPGTLSADLGVPLNRIPRNHGIARGRWTVAKEEGQSVARKTAKADPAKANKGEVVPFKVKQPVVVPLSTLQDALKKPPEREVRVIRP